MSLAGILRVWCFKTLGPLFRFDVGIQPNHKLVTGGPYGVVRHPSYIACLVSHIAGLFLLVSSGTYVKECVIGGSERIPNVVSDWHVQVGGWRYLTRGTGSALAKICIALALFLTYTVNSAITEVNLMRRLGWEEEVLLREFGKDWERYTEKVKYKIIPWIL